MVKLRFYGLEIFKNIRVVLLEIIQNRDARTIVDEFAALIEKRGVIFVSFNHKRRLRVAQSS